MNSANADWLKHWGLKYYTGSVISEYKCGENTSRLKSRENHSRNFESILSTVNNENWCIYLILQTKINLIRSDEMFASERSEVNVKKTYV